MSNWKLINRVLIYDGTFEGFLTIVFNSYTQKTLPQNIYCEEYYTPNFLDNISAISTNYTTSDKTFKAIEKLIGTQALYNCYNAFLSNEKNKEIYILKYLCTGFDVGPKINNMLTLSYVFKVINMKTRSLKECHRLKGLLRFIDVGNNIYYSSIHPDNNIIESLAQHFIKRFPNQNFIIHDKNREICLLYNCKSYEIIDSKNLQIPTVSNEELTYQKLWKTFFKTIAISERKNSKCQMQFMPKKYWSDLIEEPY